jgi:hypothetical protein
MAYSTDGGEKMSSGLCLFVNSYKNVHLLLGDF